MSTFISCHFDKNQKLKDNENIICKAILLVCCGCEMHYVGLHKAKFEGIYLCNNAMNQKLLQGIVGEILFSARFLQNFAVLC